MGRDSLSHESLVSVCSLWRASRLACLSARFRVAKYFLSEGLCWSRQPLVKASSTHQTHHWGYFLRPKPLNEDYFFEQRKILNCWNAFGVFVSLQTL